MNINDMCCVSSYSGINHAIYEQVQVDGDIIIKYIYFMLKFKGNGGVVVHTGNTNLRQLFGKI